MKRIKSRKAKAATILGSMILAIGILFFLLRGPYLSNSIKRVIIPVLENATRERIVIDKAVINLFPFYVQAKKFKLLDKNGNMLLWISKARVYIDMLGLLSNEIRVRKLTFKKPALTASDKDLKRIIENLKRSSSVGEEKHFIVNLKNIELTEGMYTYVDTERKISLSGSDLFLDMVAKKTSSTINVSMKQGTVKLPDNTEIDGSFDGKIKFKDNRIKITELNIHSAKSSLSTKGEMVLSPEGKVEDGSFSTKIEIYTEILNKIFGLQQEKEGSLSFEGSIRLFSNKNSKWPAFALDIDTDSQFYLETLMEILDIDENIKGKLSIDGKISGTYPDLTAKGKARLDDALFDTLPLDDLVGNMTYENNKFALKDFTARAYKGKLAGDAHILIPSGDYSVVAALSDVSSPDFFKFIEWEPPFPAGRINGNVQLDQKQDRDIEVLAEVNYRNDSPTSGDVLSRLNSIHTDLELKDDILNLKNCILSTPQSDLILNGDIDLKNDVLDLVLFLESRDISDLAAPYYTKFIAPVKFKGTLTGLADDPEIAGTLEADSGSVEGIEFTNAVSDVTYRKRNLIVDGMHIHHDKGMIDVSGTIGFRKTENLFSFKDPSYNVRALLKNVDVRPFVDTFYKDIPVSGFVNGPLSVNGDSVDFKGSGDLVISDFNAYGHELDRIDVKATLHPDNIELQSVRAHKGESHLTARGTFFYDNKFSISASSDKIRLLDFPIFSDYDIDAIFGLDLDGEGTVDNPIMKFSINMEESRFRGVQIGKGKMYGDFRDKKLNVDGSFIDGLVDAHASAVFSDGIIWDVDAELKKGRYDHLISNFIRRIPEDFAASLEGNVELKGHDRTFSLNSTLRSVLLSLYGYDLRNNGDIILDFVNDELRIKSFSLADKNAGISAEGSVKIDNEYDLTVSGYLNTAPLISLSDAISSLSGQCNFAFGVHGAWNNPQVVGDVNVRDVSAGLAELPYKIGPVNGTVLLKKDRITFHALHAGFSDGDAILTGAGYLDGLDVNRFVISAELSNIKMRPADGLSTVFDGNLFYEMSAEGSNLTGNIDLRKASYKKRIKWKSWLLGFRQGKARDARFPEFIGETALNIHVRGSENILIDNNIVRTPVKMDLNVTGTIEHIGLLGRVEANEGTVYFRSNEFRILEGTSVYFVEPEKVVPVFHINTDSYINDYHVRLAADGTIDNFNLSLFSDPPLAEADILALITFGQVGKEAKGIDTGVAAGEAASILTGSLQEAVEEEYGYLGGIDRFEVQPHTTTEGALVPKVVVGKRLFEDKLFVIYSTAIGTAEDNLVRLEYRLNKEVSLVGARNEIGSVGGGLIYRFEFK